MLNQDYLKIYQKAPDYRGDALVQENFQAPHASMAVWEKLKKEGCNAFKFHWNEENPLLYLSEEDYCQKFF